MASFMPEGRMFDTIRNRKLLSTPATLAEAAARQEIVEAKAVLCDFDHNLVVDLGCMKGIIPREEGAIGIAEGKVRDIALISRVGKAVSFVVTAVKTGKDGKLYALLSRRKAQEICTREFIAKLSPGDIIDARITHLESFGAFCDIGCGVVALLPIDAISVSRISHPADRFRAGSDIRVVVRGHDALGRVSLSHKELLGTWEENAARFSLGETVSGIVRSVESYGVFIELAPNLAGLAEPYAGVKVGQQASAYIKNMLPDKMKVKLIIIDAFDGEPADRPMEYFFTGDHIDSWRYSPQSCDRCIESVFESALVGVN